MTGIAPPSRPSGRPHAADLTRVELTWVEKRIENWIRFGRIVEDTILDRRRRVVGFAPGSIFAFVRWSANDYGTISSCIDIVRAVPPGAAYTTLPFVRPGGDILLHIHGWPKVEKVLQAIDAVEAIGVDPADAAPDHWRHVHTRLTVGHQPHLYTNERHGCCGTPPLARRSDSTPCSRCAPCVSATWWRHGHRKRSLASSPKAVLCPWACRC